MVLNILMFFFKRNNRLQSHVHIYYKIVLVYHYENAHIRRFPVLTVDTLYHLIHFVQSTYSANVIFMMDAIHEKGEADFSGGTTVLSYKVVCMRVMFLVFFIIACI